MSIICTVRLGIERVDCLQPKYTGMVRIQMVGAVSFLTRNSADSFGKDFFLSISCCAVGLDLCSGLEGLLSLRSLTEDVLFFRELLGLLALLSLIEDVLAFLGLFETLGLLSLTGLCAKGELVFLGLLG